MNILLIIALLVGTLISLPFVFVLGLSIAWSTIYQFVQVFYLILIVLFYAYIWITTIRWIRKKKSTRRYHLCFLLPMLGCILVLAGTLAYENYSKRFDVVSNDIDLQEYEPFTSEKLVVLDAKSTYQMKEPLVRLDGATAFYPVYSAFTQAVYPQGEYPVYDQGTVICSTTPGAYEGLLQKESDLIFVAAPSKEQKEMFDKAGEELVMTPIGKEAFVFFVNEINPVKNVTSDQIRKIYSGELTNWKEAGGEDITIRAFQRPEGSGSQSALIRMMGDTPLMKPEVRDVASGMGDIIKETAEYENRNNAIGYSFRYYTMQMVQNKDIRLLAIDGVEPSRENIRKGTYPFTNDLYAIHLKSNTNPNIVPFLDWIQSEQGQELITKTGYVGIKE